MKKIKNAKKYLSVILALCLMLTSVPLAANFAFAAKTLDKDKIYKSQDGEWQYKKLDDENIEITKYLGHGFTVNYPNTIDGYKVLSVILEFNDRYNIRTLNFAEGIEAVQGVLNDTYSAMNVYLPSTLKFIGRYTFSGVSLNAIKIPESLEGIDNYGFYGAKFPKGFEFNFPDGFKYLGANSFCETNISAVRFGKNAKLIDYCFYSPAGVMPGDEPDFTGYWPYTNPFDWTDYLTTIEVDPENPYLTAIDNVLFTKDLEYLIASHANPQWMDPEHNDEFEEFGRIPIAPEYDYVMPEGVRHIVGGAFSFCTARNLTISSTVETIGENAFQFFEAKSLTFAPNSKLRKIDTRGFYGTDFDFPLTLPKSLEEIGVDGFGGSDITALSFETPSSLTTIGESAFADCWYLESVFLPNSLTALGAYRDIQHNFYVEADAFRDCRNLKTVIFEDNSKLTSTGANTFSDCPSLKVIDFGENSALETLKADFGGSSIEALDLSGCKNLKTIRVDEFKNCKALKAVDLRNTKVYEIDKSVFEGCDALETVYLPESTRIIAERGFYGCKSLGSINLDKVTVIKDEAFTGCDLLNPEELIRETKVTNDNIFFYTITNGEVTITDWNEDDSFTELIIPDKIEGLPVTEIHRTKPYSYYTSELNYTITKVHIPVSLKYIGDDTFWDIRGIVEANVPESLEYIGENAFYYINYLNGSKSGTTCELNLPNVKIIGEQAFCGTNIGTVHFSEKLTSIDNSAFKTCKIKEVELPESLLHIGKDAFNLDVLEKISYGSKLSDLNLIPENYYRTNYTDPLGKLQSVSVSPDNPYFHTDDGVLYNKDKTELLLYPQAKPESYYEVLPTTVKIREHAFLKTSYLKDVKLPESLEIIEKWAFNESGLESIYFPSGLKAIDAYAFSTCQSLKTAEFSDGLTLSELTGTFNNCTSLTSADFGENTTVKLFPEDTFYQCPLESIVLPKGLIQIGDSVFSGNRFTSFEIPDTVSELGAFAFINSTIESIILNDKITMIQNSCFSGCQNLQKINLENIDGIGAYAFKECTSLTQIDLTNVRYSAPTAFEGCVNLTKFYFTDEDIKNAVVTEEEFRGNENLETIVVGNTVTEIKDYAFADCEKLESALIAPSVTEISDTAFENCANLQITCMADSYAMTYAEENEIPYTTFVVAPIPDQEYTGHALEPELNVSAKGNTLTAECDYTAVYSDNINVGTAKVNVMGLGDYSIFASLVKFNIVDNEPEKIPVIPEIPETPEIPEVPETTEKSENNKDTEKAENTGQEAVVPKAPEAEDNTQKHTEASKQPTESAKTPNGAKNEEPSTGTTESVTETTTANSEANENSDEKDESLWSRIIALIVAFFTQIAVFFKSLFN